jgi:8-oxo-dGTP pyrophosphatase MutT (NUDIX family)
MSDMPTRRAAGCVVYRRDEGAALMLLLIRDQYGEWTLPKGHLDPGESDAQAAVREVLEETGVRGELGAQVDRIEYQVRSKKGSPRLKQVAFFLLLAAEAAATPQAAEGISAAEWFAPAEALKLIGYPQVRAVVERAVAMLA